MVRFPYIALGTALACLTVLVSAATVSAQIEGSVPLTWDSGTSEEGSEHVGSSGVVSGDFLFRITPQTPRYGAWRTILKIEEGQADLYLRRSGYPNPSERENITWRSTRAEGEDEAILLPSSAFTEGQEWYILVRCVDARWTLFSGELYVRDLGALDYEDSDGSESYDSTETVLPDVTEDFTVGPEGLLFFRTEVPDGSPAWFLSSSDPNSNIYVRKGVAPFETVYDIRKKGQLLIVPTYLQASSGGSAYFVTVAGAPGETLSLTSAISSYVAADFESTTPLSSASGGYTTIQFQVPPNQIAWEVQLVPSDGDPNFCLRRDQVPSEWENNAVSEAEGTVVDSVTLSPSRSGGFGLSDGTFYVTVYSEGPYTAELISGEAAVDPILFEGSVVNSLPDKAGWHYYRLDDLDSQVGLGWELLLTDHVPGTEIAVRRNAIPSRWKYRLNNTETLRTSNGNLDRSVIEDVLQLPRHQKDIWYVGVYLPEEALGPYTLTSRKISAPSLAFNGTAFTAEDHSVGVVRYYRVDVPFEAEGWNLVVDQIEDAEGLGGEARCTLAIAKDALPTMSNEELFRGPQLDYERAPWASGATWYISRDWTDIERDNDRSLRYSTLVPMGRPLVAGTYYIGVLPKTIDANYQIRNQGIGYGESWQVPIQEISLEEGSPHVINDLALGDLQILKISLPDEIASRTFELKALTGEGFMAVRRGAMASGRAVERTTINSNPGARYRSAGDEFVTLLPLSGAGGLAPGDYFFTVVSQGAPPPEPTAENPELLPYLPASFQLRNEGVLDIDVLGEVPFEGIDHQIEAEGGRLLPIEFTVPSDGVVAVQISSTVEAGSGTISWWQGPTVRTPKPKTPDGQFYGFDGGEDGSSRNDDEISSRFYRAGNLTVPMYSTETIGATFRVLVRATPGADLRGSVQIELFGSQGLPFDSPTPFSVEHHTKGDWRYFEIDVPAAAPVAWSVEIESIQDVDDDASRKGRVSAVLRRGQAPPGNAVVSLTGESWPLGRQYTLGTDWTGYKDNPDGTGHLAAVLPFGRPLQPGHYFLGIQAMDGDVSYKIRTRGIGEGFEIPIVDVPYGEAFTVEDLPPRGVNYYRVQVPAGTPNWVLQSSAKLPGQGARWVLAKDAFVGSLAAMGRTSLVPHGAIVSRTDYPSDTDFEEHIVLPSSGVALEESTYYIAVVGEGTGAAGTVVGAGLVTVEMLQPDPLPVTDLGEFIVADVDRPLVPFSLPPGGTGLFKLTIPEHSLEQGLAVDRTSGVLSVHFLSGGREGIPRPAPVSAPEYGVEGGQPGTPVDYDGICQLIETGTHYFTARALKNEAKEWIPASGEIGMRLCSDLDRMDASKGFTRGSLTQGVWDFRLLEIPEGPDAWELIAESSFYDLAANQHPGDVSVVIRRNRLPTEVSSTVSEADEVFPPGETYWANQQSDWTQLTRAADNSAKMWSVLPMGKPLEPGFYVVGIYCKSEYVNWSLRSCLIGNGFDVPITELPFSGDDAITEPLVADAKTAHYYKVTVPSNTRSWQLGVDVTRGDWSMALRHGGLPGSRAKGYQRPEQGHGFLLDKSGGEHFLLLPEPESSSPPGEGEDPWEPYLKPGDYYIALASKGATPSPPRVGGEASEGSLFSEGTIPVEPIGTVGESGLSHPLEIDGGKNVFLEFNVPAASPALEIRLDGRAGNPEFVLWTGSDNTVPRPPSKTDTYGFLGGEVDSEHRFEANTIHTFTNVAPGNYRLVARASKFSNGYPSGTANLKISQKPNIPLVFGPVLENGEVLSHHRATLGQGRKNVYEIPIPQDYDGQAMLGWLVSLNQFQGSGLTLKVFNLDGDSNPEVKVRDQNSLVLAPPWWRPNSTWYLSVEASTITDYEISSGPVEIEGIWSMPNAFGEVFGEVGVEEAAEISEDEWQFYAIEVPEDNLGLLRTFLTAVSGSPDVYIRHGGIPTIDHRSSSQNSGAFLYDRQLTGSGSSYGNWVPSDSKFEDDLDSGTYYLGVRANNNQNARYRLEASTGFVEPLDLLGGKVTDVNIAGGDWRYYFVDIPEELGHWTPVFTRSQGNARLYVRDTAPPGFGTNAANILTDATDQKNLHNVYNGDGFEPGMIEYPFPPIRPGSRYYLGIHGLQDSTFSIESSFTERTDLAPIALAFRNGFYEGAIPPKSEIVFQVEVPFGATKWEHTSTHSVDVSVRVDQGSLPPPSNVVSNTTIIQTTPSDNGAVGEAAIGFTGWPLIHEKIYYVVARNDSNTEQAFSIAMNGELPTDEDSDEDGLPDLWERQHFSSISSFSVEDDADGDGITNLIEFALDLSPSVATSFQEEAVRVDIQDGVLVMTVNKGTTFDTSHLIYTVEASYDSKEWNTTETNILTDNPQQLIVADTIPIAAANLRFLKLTVTMEP